MTVMWALEADTVEYGEYLTGVRIEGLTYIHDDQTVSYRHCVLRLQR